MIRPVKAMPESDTGANNIKILRDNNYVGGSERIWPAVDGQAVSGLFPGEHVSFVLSPGKHSIGVGCGRSGGQLAIDVHGEKKRYFVLSPHDFSSSQCAGIVETSEAEALKQVRGSTLIKTGCISDCKRKSVLYDSNPDYFCYFSARP